MYLNSDILTESILTKLKKKGNSYLKVLNRVLKMVSIPTKPRYYAKSLNNTNNIVKSNNIKKTVITSIKNKHIFGVRFEAAGRLSKRLTASRSVFAIKHKGSIRNPDSSFNGISSYLLRNHQKSNVQYTFFKGKTRNGAFGLKG